MQQAVFDLTIEQASCFGRGCRQRLLLCRLVGGRLAFDRSRRAAASRGWFREDSFRKHVGGLATFTESQQSVCLADLASKAKTLLICSMLMS